MSILLWIHIAGGCLAIVAGVLAVAAPKGGALHTRAGTWFFASMLGLGVTATVLAELNDEPDTGVGGLLTCYFVATSWVAARRHDGSIGRFEVIACAFALGMAGLMTWGGVTADAALTPVGNGPVFALAAICLLAGLLDLRAVLRKKLAPLQRIARHLWRMCFAFFIATGSFFIGQQDVMPAAVRGSPLLLVLGFAPLALILFWLARVRFGRKLRSTLEALGGQAAAPLARD